MPHPYDDSAPTPTASREEAGAELRRELDRLRQRWGALSLERARQASAAVDALARRYAERLAPLAGRSRDGAGRATASVLEPAASLDRLIALSHDLIVARESADADDPAAEIADDLARLRRELG